MALDPVFGDLRLDAEIRDNQIKGNLLTKRTWYVKEHFGQQGLDSFLEALSPEGRGTLLKPPLTFAWYPLGLMMDIDRVIVERLMEGDLSRMRQFGAEIAKHDLPLLYKVLFKVGSPAFVVKRLNVAARTYLKDTTVEVEMTGATAARVVLSGRRLPYYFCRWGCSGWFEAAVELSGGRDIAVEHPACVHEGAQTCQWQVSWT
jgi:uncharacterized protein (TIGR02265 family)